MALGSAPRPPLSGSGTTMLLCVHLWQNAWGHIHVSPCTRRLRWGNPWCICTFQGYSIMNDTCTYCDMTATIRLLNTPITSHSYNFLFLVMRTFRIYSPGKFKIYNTVLLTINHYSIVTNHHAVSPELTYNWRLIPFDHLHPFPSPPPTPPATTNMVSVSMSFFFLDSTYK